MCGIAGIFQAGLTGVELTSALERMAESMAHRGPDDTTVAVFADLHSGLACRRLSLVDLANGRQPAAGEDGSVHVLLNGEIYNRRCLRTLLESRGHRFHTRSDTEVIVHCYEEFGLDCLNRLNGMFALAILDGRERKLVLARDGPGMRHLYYTQTGSGFLFASEAKALFASGLVKAAPNWPALDTCLGAGYIPAPETCFRGIERLPAGGLLVAGANGIHKSVFWRMRYQNHRPRRRDEEYGEELGNLLRDAVSSHLDADVPVGAFLSGGWDSSLTASMAAQLSPKPLKTFSIVFPDHPRMDESRYSRLLARHLGSEHREIEFRAPDAVRLFPGMVEHLEEPCTAAPAMLLWQLCSLAAREVKTVLSGEGSDELFAGYPWLLNNSFCRLRRIVPGFVARLLEAHTRDRRWLRLFMFLSAPDERAADAEWFRQLTPAQKRYLLRPELAAGPDIRPTYVHPNTLASCADRLQRRLSLDFTGRLSDGILFMEDKMAMAHSLEIRMPFLDRAVVDFALALPSDLKIRKGREKYILTLLGDRLPPEIAQRRKRGLDYPRKVFSGTFSKFARELLLDSASPGGLFERRHLEPWLNRALTGEHGEHEWVFSLMLLQAWWNRFIARPEPRHPRLRSAAR